MPLGSNVVQTPPTQKGLNNIFMLHERKSVINVGIDILLTELSFLCDLSLQKQEALGVLINNNNCVRMLS